MISGPAWQQMFTDPELELALASIVHGDQRFDYRDPLRAGDVVSATLTIDKVRVRAGSRSSPPMWSFPAPTGSSG